MCAINTPSAVSMATAPNPRGVDGRRVNPTPVGGGRFPPPPYRKMAITLAPDDYQQFWVHFVWFFIFLMKNGYYCSSSKKYTKMVLFGLKTNFKFFFLSYFYLPTLPMQKIGS